MESPLSPKKTARGHAVSSRRRPVQWRDSAAEARGAGAARERDDRNLPTVPAVWPSVTAVVPARDEADVIARSIGSLLAQDYPGPFTVILVDDASSDGTAAAARGMSSAQLNRATIAAGHSGRPGAPMLHRPPPPNSA